MIRWEGRGGEERREIANNRSIFFLFHRVEGLTMLYLDIGVGAVKSEENRVTRMYIHVFIDYWKM